MPPLRMMVLPAADVEIVDTWTVSGLCGTGSHDFTIEGVFVPDDRTFSVFEEGGLDGALGRIPELSYSSLEFANVAVGIAEEALAEITSLATGKVPMFADATLAASPLFRYQLGEADARLRAADALLRATVASTWETAVSGVEFTPEQRARIRATATWVTTTAAAIVDVAYTAGGGTARARAVLCSGDCATRTRSPNSCGQARRLHPGRCRPRRSRRGPQLPLTHWSRDQELLTVLAELTAHR